jgi:hypothetical protein
MRRMLPRLLASLPLALLACSAPVAPPADQAKQAEPAGQAPTRLAEPAPAPEPTSEPAKADPKKKVYTLEELDKIGPRPAPEPPLTQAELDLIAADPKTLSRDDRIKRAYAQRRKTLQNPDTPLARQLEALRIAHSKGELNPQLPDQSSVAPPPEPTKQ